MDDQRKLSIAQLCLSVSTVIAENCYFEIRCPNNIGQHFIRKYITETAIFCTESKDEKGESLYLDMEDDDFKDSHTYYILVKKSDVFEDNIDICLVNEKREEVGTHHADESCLVTLIQLVETILNINCEENFEPFDTAIVMSSI